MAETRQLADSEAIQRARALVNGIMGMTSIDNHTYLLASMADDLLQPIEKEMLAAEDALAKEVRHG